MARKPFIFACFHQRDHAFMTSTRKGAHVLPRVADSNVFKQIDLLYIFADGVGGGSQNC